MMGTEIFKIDASWAEKWTKTRVSFLSAPTVHKVYLDLLIIEIVGESGHEQFVRTVRHHGGDHARDASKCGAWKLVSLSSEIPRPKILPIPAVSPPGRGT